ncbi:hypothetical protein DFJ73DRAFT_756988 [Zopfochytrium polystomum]|nr:hypothetical protein DFJ73DRAFT_756988 [Zopfochytrium polystomum]
MESASLMKLPTTDSSSLTAATGSGKTSDGDGFDDDDDFGEFGGGSFGSFDSIQASTPGALVTSTSLASSSPSSSDFDEDFADFQEPEPRSAPAVAAVDDHVVVAVNPEQNNGRANNVAVPLFKANFEVTQRASPPVATIAATTTTASIATASSLSNHLLHHPQEIEENPFVSFETPDTSHRTLLSTHLSSTSSSATSMASAAEEDAFVLETGLPPLSSSALSNSGSTTFAKPQERYDEDDIEDLLHDTPPFTSQASEGTPAKAPKGGYGAAGSDVKQPRKPRKKRIAPTSNAAERKQMITIVVVSVAALIVGAVVIMAVMGTFGNGGPSSAGHSQPSASTESLTKSTGVGSAKAAAPSDGKFGLEDLGKNSISSHASESRDVGSPTTKPPTKSSGASSRSKSSSYSTKSSSKPSKGYWPGGHSGDLDDPDEDDDAPPYKSVKTSSTASWSAPAPSGFWIAETGSPNTGLSSPSDGSVRPSVSQTSALVSVPSASSTASSDLPSVSPSASFSSADSLAGIGSNETISVTVQPSPSSAGGSSASPSMSAESSAPTELVSSVNATLTTTVTPEPSLDRKISTSSSSSKKGTKSKSGKQTSKIDSSSTSKSTSPGTKTASGLYKRAVSAGSSGRSPTASGSPKASFLLHSSTKTKLASFLSKTISASLLNFSTFTTISVSKLGSIHSTFSLSHPHSTSPSTSTMPPMPSKHVPLPVHPISSTKYVPSTPTNLITYFSKTSQTVFPSPTRPVSYLAMSSSVPKLSKPYTPIYTSKTISSSKLLSISNSKQSFPSPGFVGSIPTSIPSKTLRPSTKLTTPANSKQTTPPLYSSATYPKSNSASPIKRTSSENHLLTSLTLKSPNMKSTTTAHSKPTTSTKPTIASSHSSNLKSSKPGLTHTASPVGSTPSSAPSSSALPSVRCDGECPHGQTCYADLPTQVCMSPTSTNATIAVPTVTPSLPTFRCGSSWTKANQVCGLPCPKKDDVCPENESCWADLSTAPCASKSLPTYRCGINWAKANEVCGISCTNKDDKCPENESCWADLSISPCAATANATVSSASVANLGPSPTSAITVSPSPTGSASQSRCGVSWAAADANCGEPCPAGLDEECPVGQKCFADLGSMVCSKNETSYVPFVPRNFTKPGVIAYWTNWSVYSRKQNGLEKLNFTGVSAVNYAFFSLDANGKVISYDPEVDSVQVPLLNRKVREANPSLLSVASIGGWSKSTHFSTVLKSNATATAFVKNIKKFLNINRFDGVDIDFEYPGGGGLSSNSKDSSDALKFARFLVALRNELGPNRLLSIAVSADPTPFINSTGGESPATISEMIANSVSYIQVMSYDFAGPWSSITDMQAPLKIPAVLGAPKSRLTTPPSSASEAVARWSSSSSPTPSPSPAPTPLRMYLTAAIPVWKIVLGVPFYGHSWSPQSAGPSTATQPAGFHQPCAKAGQSDIAPTPCKPIPGDPLDVDEAVHTGIWMYLNLRGAAAASFAAPASQLQFPLNSTVTTDGARTNWTRTYLPEYEAPVLYNPAYVPVNGKGAASGPAMPVFISYDDVVSVEKKAQWAKSTGLGGVMAWEVTQDFNGELLDALVKGFA